MKMLKIQSKIINNLKKITIELKKVIFKNKDFLTGEELVEGNIISHKSFEIFMKIKKLRQINNIYYLWDYNKEFKRLIYAYKYYKKKKLSEIIGELIKRELEFVINKEKIDIVITVPINKKRKNERGFNQADEIIKSLGIKYVQLERTKNTKKMYELLDVSLREKNIKGSFFINGKVDYKNKNILLFDDIITTGSTLKEIKNSILNNVNENEKINIKFIVFCLAAANEIKKNKGEI